jgi:hypothetical protein
MNTDQARRPTVQRVVIGEFRGEPVECGCQPKGKLATEYHDEMGEILQRRTGIDLHGDRYTYTSGPAHGGGAVLFYADRAAVERRLAWGRQLHQWEREGSTDPALVGYLKSNIAAPRMVNP